MKILLVIAIIVIITWGVSGKSFNNGIKEKLNHAPIIAYRDTNQINKTYIDLLYGTILGWQTQQVIPGQCYKDTYNYYLSLNDTLSILLISYLPTNWFHLLDKIRINVDSYSKSLQSWQVHSILLKLQYMFTQTGIIETMARLMTQIAYLQSYLVKFSTNFAAGNYTVAGMQIGLLSSAIVGVTVN